MSCDQFLQELQQEQVRRQRLAHNVAQIEAREAEEDERRRLLTAPTESAEVDPSERHHSSSSSSNMGAGSVSGSIPVQSPDAWKRGDPAQTYPYQSPASQSSNSSSTDPYAYTSPKPAREQPARDAHDPNAPVDNDLRARSQREMEMTRRRMEVSKSPLSGFVPIDPGRSERAGRVTSDSVKGDEARGDVDAETDPGAVIPRPRRRGGGAAQASTGGSKTLSTEELAQKSRVDATTPSEIQDVQNGTEAEIKAKAKELERRDGQ